MRLARLFLLPACLVAALILGSSCQPSVDGSPEPRETRAIGVWLGGLDFHFEPSTVEDTTVVGFILSVQVDDPVDDPYACLQEGRIVSTFRSAREAWDVAGAAIPSGWYRAEYSAAGWRFVSAHPPREDILPHKPEGAPEIFSDIGPPDAGLKSGCQVTVFPEPLQSRGVGIAWWYPKARALRSFAPLDRTLSFFTSWSDLEARLDGAEPEALWVYQGGRLERTEWATHAALKPR